MDTHTDTAVAEASPETGVDALPDASGDNLGFQGALEAALAKLDAPSAAEEAAPEQPQAAEEVAETATEEITEAKEPTEESTEKATEEKVEAEDSSEEETSEAKDALDSLSEELDDWTPKAANRFKQLKSELKSNQTEVEQLRQQLKEQSSKIDEMNGLVESKDVDALQEKLSVYEKERSFTDLESTEAYQQAITEPLGVLLEQVSAIADHYDIDTDALIDVVAMDDGTEQDAALKHYLPTASERDKARLYRIIEDIDPLLARREELVEHSEQALTEARAMEEQKMNEVKAENARVRQNVAKTVVEKVQEKLPFLKGLDDLDMATVQEAIADIDPSVVHPVDFAYSNVASKILPNVVRELMKSRKTNDNLLEKLSSYESAEPTMSGSPTSSEGKTSSSMSFSEAVNAAFG